MVPGSLSPDRLNGKLPDKNYTGVMKESCNDIRYLLEFTLGIDGAANVMSSSICNVVVHVPPFFLMKYLNVNLKKTWETVTGSLWAL